MNNQPETTEITIGKATIKDLSQIKSLGTTSYKQYAEVIGNEHWAVMERNLNNDEMLRTMLNKATCFVARNIDQIVGMAFLLPSGNTVDVYEADWCSVRLVAVHPDFRGKQIAKTLTKACIEQAIVSGEKIMALHTSTMMPAAVSLYENLGFKKLKDIGSRFGQPYFLYTLNLSF
ncbi:GNAT family N-acetyltransferase [Mucilaginibacter auburnensis]|uniref:Acetyltransferase (GNAT) family protein n=1 Tax=Mucilaginibacter auburnensis TaxID=1457233 RepID=A0A2H9VVS4_9SPHI|nr:GNAT family N-acetyltransferase [Mucilaginibacter auburnensis]PJJ84920.1 acetyltransferase (GNAT) family protein [Mucilaginibacter auburnensis]